MVVKKALLNFEKEKIRQFLFQNGLRMDTDLTETLYLEEEGKIIASISRNGYLIKDLAVDRDYRGENLGGLLVSEILNSLREENRFYYQVFTKTEYIPVFSSLGFNLIANTDKVAILESGTSDIIGEIGRMKAEINRHFRIDTDVADIGAIVVNCNPITKGHYQLIMKSARLHDYFLVLVVEEDQSVFTYAERWALVKKALEPYRNILVLPSTRYIVSSLTFPSYFLKSIDEAEAEHARLDAIIFRDYFVPLLHIVKRYVGGETEPVMVTYNQLLKEYLGDRLVLSDRFQMKGNVISASLVRKLMYEGRIEEALEYVPETTRDLFKEFAKQKYEAKHSS